MTNSVHVYLGKELSDFIGSLAQDGNTSMGKTIQAILKRVLWSTDPNKIERVESILETSESGLNDAKLSPPPLIRCEYFLGKLRDIELYAPESYLKMIREHIDTWRQLRSDVAGSYIIDTLGKK